MNEKQLLDSVEKEYLEAIIRPFRKKVDFIGKERGKKIEQIAIYYGCGDAVYKLPKFKKGKMYKGMCPNTKYTLSELGLFEEEENIINDTDLDSKSQSLLLSIKNKLHKECKCFRNAKLNSSVYVDKNGEISKYIANHAGDYEQAHHSLNSSRSLSLYRFGRTVLILNNEVKEKNYAILETDFSNVELTGWIQGLTENQKDYIKECCIYLWSHLFVKYVLNIFKSPKYRDDSVKDLCSLSVNVNPDNNITWTGFVYKLYVTCGIKNKGDDEYHTFEVPLI